MLNRLDHIVLVCRDISQSIAEYTNLFGVPPNSQKSGLDCGWDSAVFRCANTALEIIAPTLSSETDQTAERLLGKREAALTSLVFETEDISQARHVLTRRALKPSDITDGEHIEGQSGHRKRWKKFRCPDDTCSGIKTFVLEYESGIEAFESAGAENIQSLDHVVINTPNPDRAAAHYGARLGLRFALDRTIEKFGTRFLFFRVGGLTLEVIHRLNQENDPRGPDEIWGLTWAVDDLQAAHARLSRSGLDVSKIRSGRKAGSDVFTLREGTLGIPTLFISHSPKA